MYLVFWNMNQVPVPFSFSVWCNLTSSEEPLLDVGTTLTTVAFDGSGSWYSPAKKNV